MLPTASPAGSAPVPASRSRETLPSAPRPSPTGKAGSSKSLFGGPRRGSGSERSNAGERSEAGAPAATLEAFVAKHNLAPEALAELQSLFAKTAPAQTSTPYNWDDIHKIIEERSAGSCLVIINLPDPPVVDRREHPWMSEGQQEHLQLEQWVEYMEYMEGLAVNLPRVLYVHGSGQEVIHLDHLG